MTKVIDKLTKDGKVAVLYSPGFGAGWSTWNKEMPEIIFDPAMVQLVETDQWDELATYVTLKYPGLYTGGIKDLKVSWIPKGSLFKINEYDGSESIELKENNDWIVA
jgi:hypothetical protein